MPTRFILIGTTSDGKLFYNVDAIQGEPNALYVDNNDTETPLDFIGFISNNPDIAEIHTTPFHKFIWTGMNGSLSERWKRVFMSRTQPIDEALIKNIEVKKKPKKRLASTNKNNQIFAFKSLTFSNNFYKMPNSALANRR
jgi:hypothetical protein